MDIQNLERNLTRKRDIGSAMSFEEHSAAVLSRSCLKTKSANFDELVKNFWIGNCGKTYYRTH
jgi:hypothetical protein